MSDTWEEARRSLRKLKELWKSADEDTRYDVGFCLVGMVMMAVAIIGEFGWMGLLFCFGLVLWRFGNTTGKD